MRCNILYKYSASRFSELFDIQHGLFEYMSYAYSNIQIRPQIVSVDNPHVLGKSKLAVAEENPQSLNGA